MSDLTTVANVVQYLGLNDTAATAADALLTRLLHAASAFIESNMGRIFEITAYTEVRSGKGERFITFSDYPVQSVQSVMIDGRDIPQSNGWGQPGYTFDDTRLTIQGNWFVRGMLNIDLIYTAGYPTIPYEVEQACIDLVCRKYKERDRIGVNSKIINGETIVFSKTDMTDELKSVLRAYQKVVPI